MIDTIQIFTRELSESSKSYLLGVLLFEIEMPKESDEEILILLNAMLAWNLGVTGEYVFPTRIITKEYVGEING